jgi:hypothetical protein
MSGLVDSPDADCLASAPLTRHNASMSDASMPGTSPDRHLEPRLFQPSAAALNWVIAIGLLALGHAIYLRYLVIEQTQIGLTCDAGLRTWLCLSRTAVQAFFEHEVFGWVSLGAAVLALIRPSLPLFTIGLATSAYGIVLHNAGLSGVAAAVLILCFARPVAEQDQE